MIFVFLIPPLALALAIARPFALSILIDPDATFLARFADFFKDALPAEDLAHLSFFFFKAADIFISSTSSVSTSSPTRSGCPPFLKDFFSAFSAFFKSFF